MTDEGPAATVPVHDTYPGASLARLIDDRGALPAGEVVTLAVPLAEALAQVHAQGLVHGDVTPANVRFTVDGRPLLAHLDVSRLTWVGAGSRTGTVGFLDPAADPGPAGDVHGLAATCLAALTGRAPYGADGRRRGDPVADPAAVALLDVLERALDPDPARRPSAAELAVATFDAAPARPLVLPGGFGAGSAADAAGPSAAGPPGVAGARHRRSRRSQRRPALRTALAVTALAAVTAVAAATGITWAGADADPPPAAVTRVSGTLPETRWVDVLARLDVLRSRAFAAGDEAALAGVYATGSPAGARDRLALGRLSEAGLRAEGLRMQVVAATERERGPTGVGLLVRDRMSGHRLVDATGRTVEHRPGRELRSWLLTLRREGGQWRVYDVVAG